MIVYFHANTCYIMSRKTAIIPPMKDSLRAKLITLLHRFQELAALLSDAAVIEKQEKFRALSKEYAQLEPLVQCFSQYQKNETALLSAEKMLGEKDAELQSLAKEEIVHLKEAQETLTQQLQTLLLPKDPNDDRNVLLEIR